MKLFKILLILAMLQIQVAAQAILSDLQPVRVGDTVYATKEYGYYMDGRGQIPEHMRIPPPHEENIPIAQPTKTVVPWDRYYNINKAGYRPMGYQQPLVPNYNVYYSNRRHKPYTRSQFINVWCDGTPNYDKGYCSVGDYNIYFFRARDWAWGVASAPIRNIKNGKKNGKKSALFFMVEEIGLDAPHMHAAKQWAELNNMTIFFGTIDSYLPTDWII